MIFPGFGRTVSLVVMKFCQESFWKSPQLLPEVYPVWFVFFCFFHWCWAPMENPVRKWSTQKGGFSISISINSCFFQKSHQHWLVVYLPIWIWKSVGMMTFPIYGKIRYVPNHQPKHTYLTPWSEHDSHLGPFFGGVELCHLKHQRFFFGVMLNPGTLDECKGHVTGTSYIFDGIIL